MILTHISSYLLIECVKSQTDFCAGFHLLMPFCLFFYMTFSTNIGCTKPNIHRFMAPQPFHQLKSVLMICRQIKCISLNYMVHIRCRRHQIDDFHDQLLLFLVDESEGGNNNCFFDINISFQSIATRLLSLDSY